MTADVKMVVQSFPATDQRLEQMRALQQEDATCQQVIQYHREGWPTRNEISPEVLPFMKVAPELCVMKACCYEVRALSSRYP